jgi:hypothetical protein
LIAIVGRLMVMAGLAWFALRAAGGAAPGLIVRAFLAGDAVAAAAFLARVRDGVGVSETAVLELWTFFRGAINRCSLASFPTVTQ